MRVEDAVRERKIFLGGWGLLVLLNVLFRLEAETVTDPVRAAALYELGLWMTLFAKGIGAYLTYRLSRFLGQPVWLTVVWTALSIFSLLYLIPIIALWLAANDKIRELREAHTQGGA